MHRGEGDEREGGYYKAIYYHIWTYMYTREEELEIYGRIGVTKEVHEILKKVKKDLAKKGVKESMAKIVCNLIIEKYGGKK